MTKKSDDEITAELLAGAEPALAAADDPLDDGVIAPARLHPILSDEDFLAAQAKARKSVEAERKKAAMAAVEKAEAQRLQIEEGLHTGDVVQDERVWVTLDLAPHSDRITIDNIVYLHGHRYNVTRARANVMQETQSRGWIHQEEIEGKSRTLAYQRARNDVIEGKLRSGNG